MVDSTAGEPWSRLRLHEGILNYDLVYSENNYHKVTVKETPWKISVRFRAYLFETYKFHFVGAPFSPSRLRHCVTIT